MANPELAVYTEAHLILCEIVVGQTRLSDFINEPSASFIELVNATWQDLLSEDGSPSYSAKMTIRKDEIQLAYPMDQRPVNMVRVNTQQFPVELSVSLFEVAGVIHRRPNDPTNLMQLVTGYGRQFVPVTDAAFRYIPNAKFDGQVPTVLVNSKHVRFWASS
ncbi:MAG: hypothetical protein QOF51_3725 [Chloroflexota bacterium]|jgi:hypothetical protein|nr:hypothetical protein [Chloroflexota bacterium]